MPQIRATFFFKDDGGFGWSETIHSSKATLASVETSAIALASRRIACMGNSSHLVFLRISDDLVRRDSLIDKISPGSTTNPNPAAGGSDSANLCLLIALKSGSMVRRSLYMRGIPDNCVTDSGQFTPSGPFTNAFNSWSQMILADGWAIRSRDPLAPTAVIVGLTQAPGTGLITVTTLLPHGFQPNDSVSITQVKGATTANGSWSIFSVPSTTTFTFGSFQLLPPWQGGGLARKGAFTINQIDTVQANRVSHRISGRPFDAPRGRRKARSRR